MFKSINTKVKKKKKGFTLIELIIVIAIIGILALIAIPKFNTMRRDSQIRADIANAKTIHDTTATLITQGTVAVPASGTTPLALSSSATGDALDIVNALQNRPTAQASSNADYAVLIAADGTVTVYVTNTTTASNQVYPRPTGVANDIYDVAP